MLITVFKKNATGSYPEPGEFSPHTRTLYI